MKIRWELCHPKCAQKVSGLSRNGTLLRTVIRPFIGRIWNCFCLFCPFLRSYSSILRWNSLFFLLELATSENTIILFVCPPKFCISIVSSFSWELQWSQEETKTMLMQNGIFRNGLWFLCLEKFQERCHQPDFEISPWLKLGIYSLSITVSSQLMSISLWEIELICTRYFSIIIEDSQHFCCIACVDCPRHKELSTCVESSSMRCLMDSFIWSFCLATLKTLERKLDFAFFRFSDKTDRDPFSVDEKDDDNDDDDVIDDDNYNDDHSRSFWLMICWPYLIFTLLYFAAVHKYHQRYTRERG